MIILLFLANLYFIIYHAWYFIFLIIIIFSLISIIFGSRLYFYRNCLLSYRFIFGFWIVSYRLYIGIISIMLGFITFIVCLDFVKFNIYFSLSFVFISVIGHSWVCYLIYVGFILYVGNILYLLFCFSLAVCGGLIIFPFGVIRIYDFLRLNSLWRKNQDNCLNLWIIYGLIIIILCSFLLYGLFNIKWMHLIFILMTGVKVSLLIMLFLL